MDWKDRLELLRWRALEEADTDGVILPTLDQTEATRSAATDGHFLQDRARLLAQHASTTISGILESMTVPSAKPWAWAGWLVALVIGYGFAELGTDPQNANLHDGSLQGHLINVLALPLMTILLWNAVMIFSSLIMEWKSTSDSTGLPKLLRRWALKREPHVSELTGRIVERFHSRVDPLLATRLATRARAWLHVGAAVLAFGTITGMYAKGWSREYRAVWESTLLDQPTASRLLSAIYKPASVALGVPVPVEQMTAMRSGPGRTPAPQDALPWIHLYAGTLLLLVILPRLALAALTAWRGNQRVALAWSRFDWPLYEARLKSAISGTGLVVDVFAFGWRAGEEPRDRWSTALREHLGALTLLQFHSVPTDEPDTFLKKISHSTATSVVVFNAAATPELEVHSAFARDLRTCLATHATDVQLLALLDAKSLKERRTPEAVQTRLNLWQSLLKGTVDKALTCGLENEP